MRNTRRRSPGTGRAWPRPRLNSLNSWPGPGSRRSRRRAQPSPKATRERLSLLLAGARAEAIEAARWEVARAKAALTASMVSLDETVIRAPISGIILTKASDQGETVLTGASIVVIIYPQHILLTLYI